MADFKIVLGNKNYSSWSLRGWLALKRCGVAFDEEVIPLYQDDWRARLLAVSPAGKVPVLLHGERTVWDSLAIVEYLAELFPEAGLWPDETGARALARAVSAEMHAGFAALRDDMPMNFRGDVDAPRAPRGGAAVEADIARVVELWRDCRARFGAGGPFLFGAFSAADAFYAPVAARFAAYHVDLPAPAADYRDTVLAWPDVEEWRQATIAETWVITFPVRR
ncbi:MAG: glutathione S-transferase family protein [Kiloniellales bacterium]|nr:glutathione S-transferase family protein [Kiloniellales bacterium]